jgi:pilus assembly protein CpaE
MDADLINSVITSHNSGIQAMLAPPRPEMAELVTPDAVLSLLDKMRNMFDIIIVDMYSSLQDLVINILDISNLIVLVTTPEIPSIKSARLFFEVTDALEYPPDKTQLILNKADRRTGIRAADIEASIKQKVEAQFPLDERAVITAVNQGVPYITSNSSSDLSKATITYAKKLFQFTKTKP